jgi:ABC-type multidrug transport system permease subunit
MPPRKYWPLTQLVLSRLRLFLREPAAIFWVYGFPIVMLLALGIAFRENPVEVIAVDIVQAEVQSPRSKVQSDLEQRLAADSRFKVVAQPDENWQKRLQAGKTDLVIEFRPSGDPPYQLWDEPHRTESRLARYAVEAALLRQDAPNSAAAEVKHLQKPGSRYIDFLLPGMIGMNLMGGGLWGIGFVVVDMRVRKLLKRFLATPMRRSDFLLAIMLSRLFFTLADVVILLAFGYVVFGVRCEGNYLELTLAVLLGGFSFAGIGLLVASRAQTVETVSGLMNLVMLPMWILSGVFFSSERFPEIVQPLINLLPLTALNQLLRGIMLEGQSLVTHWPQVAILSAYGILTFAIALKIFRWK